MTPTIVKGPDSVDKLNIATVELVNIEIILSPLVHNAKSEPA